MSIGASPLVSDRLRAALRQIVREEFPQLSYLGVIECSVQATDGTKATVSPTDTTLSIQQIPPCEIRLPLGTVTPPVGSLCLVAFINGDPTRPIMIGTKQTPVDPTKFVARVLDLVQAGPFTGTITSGSTTARIG